MAYTQEELFNLTTMVIDDHTLVDHITCRLYYELGGAKTEVIGKRKYIVKDLIGKGYIGFDAYNHQLINVENTERIRINFIGRDFIYVFVRSPYKGNIPTMHKVSFEDNDFEIFQDCGNGVSYHLIISIDKAK
jgi:hypothetical protein